MKEKLVRLDLINFLPFILLELILVFLIGSGCKSDCQISDSQNNINSVYPHAEWDVQSPEQAGLDQTKFQHALNYLKKASLEDGIEELMIIKDGYLLYEGDSVDKVHGVWSVTKTVTSSLFGLLAGQQKVRINEPVKHQLPYLEGQYDAVQYRHFLTLTSGYDAEGANNPKHLEQYGFGDASIQPWIPAEPLFEPGSQFCYWDESMNVLAHALTRIAGQPLDQFFKTHLADPIGIDPEGWFWQKWPDARGDTLCGGSGCCHKQLNISARQLTRLGYLFLRQGKWQDKQVIPAEWVKQATQNQVDTSLALLESPRQHIDARGCYGYNWWINGIKPDGTYLMPDTPVDTYFASGFNNNMLYIIPSWDLVLVRTGIDGNPENKYGVYNQFFKLFAESLKEPQDYEI